MSEFEVEMEEEDETISAGDWVRPCFSAGGLYDSHTANLLNVSEKMSSFILKKMDDDDLLLVVSSQERPKEGLEGSPNLMEEIGRSATDMVQLIRFDGLEGYVWISDDFERVREADEAELRTTRLNEMASEHNISTARDEASETLAQYFLASIIKVQEDFAGISRAEIAVAFHEAVMVSAMQSESFRKRVISDMMESMGAVLGADGCSISQILGGEGDGDDERDDERDVGYIG